MCLCVFVCVCMRACVRVCVCFKRMKECFECENISRMLMCVLSKPEFLSRMPTWRQFHQHSTGSFSASRLMLNLLAYSVEVERIF